MKDQGHSTFPSEHMFTIVIYDLRPNSSKHHIRVYVCLTTQFSFFSRSKYQPLQECPQLKTIPATVSTSSSSPGKRCETIETLTSTGSLTMTLCLYTRTQTLSLRGYCFSWWSSTVQLLQQLKWTGHSLSRGDDSERNRLKEGDRDRLETLRADTRIFRVHVYTGSMSHTIKHNLTPHKHRRSVCVCVYTCVCVCVCQCVLLLKRRDSD
jgi:hypothetical protein